MRSLNVIDLRHLVPIEEYRKWDDDEVTVIILLCGKTDKNLFNDLKKHVSGGWLSDEKAVIIQK